MFFALLFALFSGAAHAVAVRPSVTGVEGAGSVHLLFGEDGEDVASCVPATGGWSCSGVEIDGIIDAYLLIDTDLVSFGPLTIQGADLTIDRVGSDVVVRWEKGLEPVEGTASPVQFVRVHDPESERAPMIRLAAGTFSTEVSCADDGGFPDGTPNDGVFHCAKMLPPGAIGSDRSALEVSMRAQDGTIVILGAFTYTGSTGLRFATVTVGDPSQASNQPFVLVGPKARAPEEEVEPDTVPEMVQPEPQEMVQPEPGPPGPQRPVWIWALGALAVGWLLGRRGSSAEAEALDGAVPLPVKALDGRGPVPDRGAIVVSSANPSATLLHVAKNLMIQRRVLLLGSTDDAVIDPVHPVHRITDPDRHAVHALIKKMRSDGGLPPVLLIQGPDVVLDSGGGSPTPTHDLLLAVGTTAWLAVFVSEDATEIPDVPSWGYDPQAGWTLLRG